MASKRSNFLDKRGLEEGDNDCRVTQLGREGALLCRTFGASNEGILSTVQNDGGVDVATTFSTATAPTCCIVAVVGALLLHIVAGMVPTGSWLYIFVLLSCACCGVLKCGSTQDPR